MAYSSSWLATYWWVVAILSTFGVWLVLHVGEQRDKHGPSIEQALQSLRESNGYIISRPRWDILEGENDEEARPVIDAIAEIHCSVRNYQPEWAVLLNLNSVTCIEIYGSTVTDDVLRSISCNQSISTLTVRHARITDDGVAALTRLRHLETLMIEWCDISDHSLSHLRMMPALKCLSLKGSRRVYFQSHSAQELMKQLDAIDLSETMFNGEAIHWHESSIRARRIVMSNANIASDRVRAIRDALPFADVEWMDDSEH